jgi:glucosamine-6-phosphate deaminase
VIVTEPRIVVVADADTFSRAGADVISSVVASTPAARITVATGRTPMGVYAELVRRHASGGFDPSSVRPVQLDEYLGLEREDRRALYGWMRRSFLAPLGIADARVLRLPTDGGDLDAGCAAFDRELTEAGGLDLAILGIGTNGHLGFNEPPSPADAPTRVVRLSAGTIAANASYWDGAEVPTSAVTMGMATLLAAREILLLVSGTAKRDVLRRVLDGPIDPAVPASALLTARGDVTIVVDRDGWGEP